MVMRSPLAPLGDNLNRYLYGNANHNSGMGGTKGTEMFKLSQK